MPTGLEQVHAVTDQALKQLDQDARRLNRQLNDTRADIIKSKAEYEQIAASVVESTEELKALKDGKAALLKEIDDYRTAQIAVIEAAGKKLEAQSGIVAKAVTQSEGKEQKAQAALSDFLETRSAFLQKVKTLQASIDKAIADLLA